MTSEYQQNNSTQHEQNQNLLLLLLLHFTTVYCTDNNTLATLAMQHATPTWEHGNTLSTVPTRSRRSRTSAEIAVIFRSLKDAISVKLKSFLRGL
jgi:hypothetical protein